MLSIPHITVCVCTFRRPRLLTDLVTALNRQVTNGEFTFSLVVADNDAAGSARPTVETLKRQVSFSIVYAVEPVQNIALARNRAVAEATGDYVAFIDDDEVPPPDWLHRMFTALRAGASGGVLGPVLPRYEVPPPRWAVKSGFFERPSHPTGYRLRWFECRTGNVLMKRHLLSEVEGPFRAECGHGGEDRDLFKRLIDRGHEFTWCAEAAVHETIPAHRLRRSFQMRRALLRGKASLAQSSFSAVDVVKSVAASVAYSISLPFLLLCGDHLFMKYLIKDLDHIGRLLALCGVDVVREAYVTE